MPESWAGSVTKRAVAATEKKQRFSVDGCGLLDLAEIDGVVTTRISCTKLALDVPESSLENRCSVGAWPISHALKLGASAHREAARKRFLIVGKNVDREDLALLEEGVALGLLVDTDEQNRRLQRDRSKGVGRQAVGLPVAGMGGDHGHPSSEMSHHPA